MSSELHVRNEHEYNSTFRAEKVRSQFDIPEQDTLTHDLRLDWNLPDEWNIGLIVGPSGSGKSTLAHEAFPNAPYYDGQNATLDWPGDEPVVDGFSENQTTSEVTEALSRVGFSSPPHWLQPYHTLSTGQKFRADMARLLLDTDADLRVIDEFTSTVDRTVAKSVSNAVQSFVREEDKRVVLVTCHYDVADWLEPDWVADLQREVVDQDPPFRRPKIEIEIEPTRRESWEIFREHHYLNHNISNSAQCWIGFWNDEPVTFVGVQHFPHPKEKRFKRVTRFVTLPDYQGLGVGSAVLNEVVGHYRQKDFRPLIVTSHPGLLHSLNRDSKWQCIRGLSRAQRGSRKKSFDSSDSRKRKTATFEYIHGYSEN